MKKKDAAKKRANTRLQQELYARAAEQLRKAAEWADKKDATWTKVYTESALRLIIAAQNL